MTRIPLILLASVVVAPNLAAQAAGVGRSLTDPDTERRIDGLLARMTLDEKIGQLNQYSSTFDVTGPPPTGGADERRYEHIRSGRVGAMLNLTGAAATRRAQELAVEGSRLGIPLLFGYDVIHGFRTIFPIPLAEAASWDPDAVRRSAEVAAREAAAAGVHWTFSPMVDVSRDPRWGRVMEGSGEDPYLGARMAVARVRGFQGEDLADPTTLVACAKHFAGYGFAEGGRDYNTVDVSEATLRDVILPPFEAAVEAGVATVMNAFNVLDGIPATGNAHLQRDILKSAWDFQGFVVSDYWSIREMVAHGVARDEAAAAGLAIRAGSDMDMESSAYLEHLGSLIESGAVDRRLLDDAVRRVLRVKFALGLFDDPYRYSDVEREEASTLAPENLAVARDVARRSIVLLKNEGDLLPLDGRHRRIAVIGALAADEDSPLGSWRAQGAANSAVSLLEGLRAAVGPGTTVTYARGYELAVGPRSFNRELTLELADRSGFPDALRAAAGADVVVMALGEEAFQSGEGRSQADITLKG
ncbi:MAG: glycoside hydrolase family 3 N-terminal domain-containing protein, partial [Gemmatimonadota bacterium]